MFRYAEQALILCPSYECYENKADAYYINFRRSLDNILKFLKFKDIEPCMLTTDEIANVYNSNLVTWLQVMSPSDRLFAKKNCENMKTEYQDAIEYPELYKEALTKYPFDPKASKDFIFEDLLKRVARTERAVIKQFKVIINIQTPNNASYNIKPKANSGIILINVHNGNFLVKSYMGDMELNPLDLLDYNMANRPVYEWRFE